jgi:hypothetical protein
VKLLLLLSLHPFFTIAFCALFLHTVQYQGLSSIRITTDAFLDLVAHHKTPSAYRAYVIMTSDSSSFRLFPCVSFLLLLCVVFALHLVCSFATFLQNVRNDQMLSKEMFEMAAHVEEENMKKHSQAIIDLSVEKTRKEESQVESKPEKSAPSSLFFFFSLHIFVQNHFQM